MAKKTMISLGRLAWTSGVNNKIADDVEFAKLVFASLQRHVAGDWGDVCTEDREANDKALEMGERVLSAYEKVPLPKIWIITEWDRSVTTVLFPEEY